MVSLGTGLALTRQRRVLSGGGVIDPVTDPTFVFGQDTLAGAGGAGNGDETVGSFSSTPDSATITGGTNSAHWQIVDGYKIAPSAAGVVAGLTSTPYSLSVTYTKDGEDFPHTVTITTTSGEAHVSSPAEYDAAVADAASTARTYRLRTGFAVYVFVPLGQSNGEGPAAYDSGTVHAAGTAQWYSTSGWPNNNVVARPADTTSPLLQHHNDGQDEVTPKMGFDITFANEFLTNNTNSAICFVGSCRAATLFIEHEKGSAIYADMVSRVNALMTAQPDFTFGGFLFSLGESNADVDNHMNQREASEWIDRYISDVRADVTAADGNTPFIMSGFVKSIASDQGWPDINAALEDTPSRNTFCSIIDASAYPGTDPVHFSAADLRLLGADMYDAWAAAAAKSSAPTVTTYAPADNAAGVNPNGVLALDFGELVTEGSGDIRIKNLTDATTTTITLPDSQVRIEGTTMLIVPSSPLTASKSYAVQIDSGVVEDRYGNAYAGIADDTTWNFSTGAASTVTPKDFGATNPVWFDGSDATQMNFNGSLLSDITSKGDTAYVWETPSGEPVVTPNTSTPAGFVLNGSTTKMQDAASPAWTAPGVGTTIWMAIRTGGTDSANQYLLNALAGGSGPGLLAASGQTGEAASGGTSILIHSKTGGLSAESFQIRDKLYDDLGVGSSATDAILEIRLELDWAGFSTGGSTTVVDATYYQVAVHTACDSLADRAGMLAFLQSKMGA